MGGQTALNLSVELERKQILKKFGVKLIGASQKVIKKAEDRELFKNAMKKIGIETPKGFVINNIEDSKVLQQLNFPIIIRPSFYTWRSRWRHR